MTDLINGTFEVLGGLFVALTCLRLCREKQAHGVSLWHVGFCVTWGYWSVCSATGVWSLVGAIMLATANMTWLLLVLRYRERPPLAEKPCFEEFDR